MPITRRNLSVGLLTGFSALSSLLSAPRAAAPAVDNGKETGGRQCLTVLYPWQADGRFDFDYYRDRHLGMMRDLYGSSIGAMQVRKGLHKGDGSAPAFVATATIEILSMEGFDAAGKQHLQKLFADLPNFSNIIPLGQIEQIL